LPDLPGVYQFFDNTGKIIYIGKAKNLRKRVSSYFNRTQYESAKLRALVSKVADIEYIVVNTESDALILENLLIKKYQPKYNILLRDDKTYPWIVIKNEPFRVLLQPVDMKTMAHCTMVHILRVDYLKHYSI